MQPKNTQIKKCRILKNDVDIEIDVSDVYFENSVLEIMFPDNLITLEKADVEWYDISTGKPENYDLLTIKLNNNHKYHLKTYLSIIF